MSLGIVPIPEVKISLKSRDELPSILWGLQHVFNDPALNEAVFQLLEARICGGKKATGRPGMDLWQILVLGVVRLGLDCNWDRLVHTANNDKMLRGILGVETTGFRSGDDEDFHYQTVLDNVTLLDIDTIKEIGALVAGEGHRILKKKGDPALEVKVDSFVLEANIHWPTDTNLAWDAARKCLDCMSYFANTFNISGWRKIAWWRKELKRAERSVSNAWGSRGEGKEERVAEAAAKFLQLVCRLEDKVGAELPTLTAIMGTCEVPEKYRKILYYHWFLVRQADLCTRRLIGGEAIPHGEKLFSLFEPLVEWISKGKAGKQVEFGHNILVATSQHHFILDFEVMDHVADAMIAVPFATRLKEKYSLIRSMSFDRGFFSKQNREALEDILPFPVLPKKGKLGEADRSREDEPEFKRLRNKHSAVESNINQLEHNGLGKCPDRGDDAFRRYVALGMLSYNLQRLGAVLRRQEKERLKKEAEKRRRDAMAVAA